MEDKRNIRYPVGTLVTIDGFNYPILIIAHEMWLESESKRYNYMGVQYPVGFLPEGEFEEILGDVVILNEKYSGWLDAMESKYVDKQIDEIDAVERETKHGDELLAGLKNFGKVEYVDEVIKISDDIPICIKQALVLIQDWI